MTRSHLDPTGKRALFDSAVSAASDQVLAGRRPDGKAALYSSGPRQAGTVLVQCQRCTARTRISLLDLGLRLASLSAWVPILSHSHWMRCPGCGQRTWCRIGWTD